MFLEATDKHQMLCFYLSHKLIILPFCTSDYYIMFIAELQFPNDANVYYAMDTTSSQCAFLVRKISQKTPKKLLKNKSFTGSGSSSWPITRYELFFILCSYIFYIFQMSS